MSVYTKVSLAQLNAWLAGYALGDVQDFVGIAAGIENTNYFVTTAHGRFVLTLFEKLRPEELPFYLGLMAHLAARGIPCPRPIPNRHGDVLGSLCGKPAVLVTRLAGADVDAPTSAQCAAVGTMLARMHTAARDFPQSMPNPRGLAWWRGAALEVLPLMPPEDAALLETELRFQSQQQVEGLPRGAIHADLFRDIVLFDGERSGASSTSISPAPIPCSMSSRSRSTTGASPMAAGSNRSARRLCSTPTAPCVRSRRPSATPGPPRCAQEHCASGYRASTIYIVRAPES